MGFGLQTLSLFHGARHAFSGFCRGSERLAGFFLKGMDVESSY